MLICLLVAGEFFNILITHDKDGCILRNSVSDGATNFCGQTGGFPFGNIECSRENKHFTGKKSLGVAVS